MVSKLLSLKQQKQVIISLVLIILVTFSYFISKQSCESSNKSVSQTADEQPLNIFYFAITHHLNREKLLASHKTWARTVPNVHWYSDKPDPEVNVAVISYPEGNNYSVIPFRTLIIFQDILEHHSGHDWYVRLLDDNFLFNDRLERLLRTQNPDESVLIGKVLGYNQTVPNKEDTLDKHFIYLGGGAGWVLSRAAYNILAKNHKNNQPTYKACSLDGLKEYTKYVIAIYSTAEDLMLAQCLLAQGVSFIYAFGFQNGYVTHSELQMTLQDVVDGKLTSLEKPGREEESLIWCGLVKCINDPNCHGVITLHYVKPAAMYNLYQMVQDQKKHGNQFHHLSKKHVQLIKVKWTLFLMHVDNFK